ncbi:MAG: energy transducer TonB [Comamonadaceae bacterium]|nr:energy transducer TonB [Comamonadaceae bacterium]
MQRIGAAVLKDDLLRIDGLPMLTRLPGLPTLPRGQRRRARRARRRRGRPGAAMRACTRSWARRRRSMTRNSPTSRPSRSTARDWPALRTTPVAAERAAVDRAAPAAADRAERVACGTLITAFSAARRCICRGYNRARSSRRGTASECVQGSAVGLTGALLANKVLAGAFAVSVAVHAAVLAVRFVDPEFLRVRASDPTLEIILVNARSETRPSQAQALAQANLDGGGTNDDGRRTSPLPETCPDARRRHARERAPDGRAARAGAEAAADAPVGRRCRRCLCRARDAGRAAGAGQRGGDAPDSWRGCRPRSRSQISDYQKRPRKHHFMPSTSEYRYARYVEDWRARVEKIGNEHYPEEARGRVYGTLRMTVSIRKDGSLVEAIIENSSGSPVLDRAARRIVKLAGAVSAVSAGDRARHRYPRNHSHVDVHQRQLRHPQRRADRVR